MTTNENTPITYPHKDGPVTVLGPEIFASTPDPTPETVISWRGVNFTVQAATILEVRAAEVREGDEVYVGWLAGWQVVGDVRADDGLVTILDRWCDVPLFDRDPGADSLVIVRRIEPAVDQEGRNDG